MKRFLTGISAFALLTAAPAIAQNAEISPNGSRASIEGSAEYFTGSVIVDPLFDANEQLQATGANVTFAPGARSAWHSHPAGQMMIVTSGTGWVQEEGGEKRGITPGDVIWTPPGVKHWHGATATNSMTHMVISNMLEGKNVEWMEKVSDEQYGDQ
ncbi:MAG: cupin domain-containing protein [Gammaproteobacteria bacterium]